MRLFLIRILSYQRLICTFCKIIIIFCSFCIFIMVHLYLSCSLSSLNTLMQIYCSGFVSIDFFLKTLYHMFMETLFYQTIKNINSWIESFSGKSAHFRLSKKAMLSSSDFILEDPLMVAEALAAVRKECSFMGVPMIRSIRCENGWLLIDLEKTVFDTFALLLPDQFDYGDSYVDKRMEMFLRHGDCSLPPYDPVLKAVLTASYASTRGRWTKDDEQAVLTMTHTLSGMERVRTEHAISRAAKIILFERRSLL